MKKNIIAVILFIFLLGAFFLYFYSSSKEEGVDSPTRQEANLSTDSQNQLQKILEIKNYSEKIHQLELFLAKNLELDPITTLGLINELNSEEFRQLSYNIAFELWSKLDSSSFHAWLKTANSSKDYDLALVKLIELGTRDIESSILYLNKISAQSTLLDIAPRFIENYVLLHTETVLSWVISKEEQKKWISLGFQILTKDSLTNAIDSLSILEEGSQDQLYSAIQAIIDNYELGVVNSDTLLVMESLTPYSIREEVISALLPLLLLEEHLTLNDLSNLIGSLLPGSLNDSLHETVSTRWATKNPIEAAEYAESLSGEARSLAINGVVNSWLATDLQAADEWLHTLDGNIDLAASTIGRGSASLGNIQIADNWINYIEDEALRTDAITEVLQGWYGESPEAGIYHLVYQKSLTNQQKLDMLHEIYPGEVFITPMDALDNIGRLEGLRSGL